MNLRNSAQSHSHIVLVVSSLFHAITDATFAILPAVLPLLAKNFALSYTDIGFLYGAMLAVMVALQFIAGDLADKYDELDLLATGCFIIFLSCMLMLYARTYVELFTFNMFYTIGFSIFHPVSYTVISRTISEEKDRTKAMGFSGSIGDFGNFIAFLSTGFIASIRGWRFPFLIWGLMALLVVIIYITFLRRLKQPSTNVEFNKPQNPEFSKKGALSQRFTVLVLASCIFMGALYRTFINNTTLFLTDIVHMTLADADLIFSMFVLSGVIGAFSSGYLAKHFGLKNSIILEFIVLAPSTLLLYFGFTQTLLPVLLILVISGFFLYATYPAIYSLAADITSFRGRGRSYGIIISITFVGGSALSFISGKLADYVGNISIVYLLGAVIALLAIIIAKYIPR